MKIRCKMICSQKTNSVSPYQQLVDGRPVPNKPTCRVHLIAVVGDENKTWAKFTPSGTIDLEINNPEAYDGFVLGQNYLVDFIPTDETTHP